MTCVPAIPVRRGAALLVVLAVTAMTTASLVVIARLTATASLVRTTTRDTMIADDLFRAAEGPLQAWLGSEAGEVVLPPDAASPRVALRHDRWTLDGVEFEVAITAFDQCGMVSIETLRGPSPLRAAIGEVEIEPLLDATKSGGKAAAGLDLAGAGIYPGREPGSLAAGECVATHNPPPSRVNVNTAPLALIEAALKRAGRGGLEPIVAARSAGERFTLPAPPASARRSRTGGTAPLLVATSDAWSFRIDVSVGRLTRSWWCVYRRAADGRPWECVQRLAILD